MSKARGSASNGVPSLPTLARVAGSIQSTSSRRIAILRGNEDHVTSLSRAGCWSSGGVQSKFGGSMYAGLIPNRSIPALRSESRVKFVLPSVTICLA
jgi:hypothetical protein